MKRRILLLIGLMALIVVSFSSCSGNKYVTDANSFSKTGFRLEDYEVLGQTTVTVESRTYLGVIHIIDKVNDEPYNPRDKQIVRIYGSDMTYLNGDLNKAIYKVLEEYPDAEFLMPTIAKKEISKLFLGRYTKQTMVVKAYKLRY